MPKFISKHPYIVSFIIVLLILFFIGIFALSASWSESLFGAAAISARAGKPGCLEQRSIYHEEI